jgi:tetratricopeptide (TPR) repeat protein
MTSSITRKISLAFAAIALAGCASAGKRYEQGAKLQLEGRHAEAAERYIQALKKDSRLDSARAGLRASGAAAIDQYLRIAADPSTQAPAAADQYLAVDALQKRALEVGVFLPEPNGYAEAKRAAFDRAIARAISDAPLLVAQRQYSDALARLQRAATAYQPGAAQVSAIGGTGADVMLGWARADTAEGRFRAAYERVERMGEVTGATTRQVDDARALQLAALSRGTRRVAVVPAWGTVAARNELPEDALPALGDALLENPWLTPPRFVAVFPADQVERELRRMGLARRTITSSEAARLGRNVGADYVVVTEIDSVHRADVGVRSTRRPVRTRSGIDTAYYIEEGSARLYTRATFVTIGDNGQRLSDYQSVSSSVSSPFTRVRYAGDYRSLDLRQSERDLFERSRTQGELSRAFVNEMSPRLAEAVFAVVARQIP